MLKKIPEMHYKYGKANDCDWGVVPFEDNQRIVSKIESHCNKYWFQQWFSASCTFTTCCLPAFFPLLLLKSGMAHFLKEASIKLLAAMCMFLLYCKVAYLMWHLAICLHCSCLGNLAWWLCYLLIYILSFIQELKVA